MCGFVGDAIGGVVKAIGSVAKAVVKNALPILETVALTAVLGPAGLGLSKLTATVISRVAVTALNGGSLLDVATAGLTPMLPSIGQALGVNLDASGFISKSVSNLLGNSTLASVVAGAIGEGTTAGVMAAITGGDVLKAATFAGLNNVVGMGLSKAWDSARSAIPALAELQDGITNKLDALQGRPETLSTIKTMAELEADLTGRAEQYNEILKKYQDAEHIFNIELAEYDKSVANNDVMRANGLADVINNGSGKTVNELGSQLNTLYGEFETKNLEFQDFLKINQADIDYAAPLIQEIADYESQYNLFDNKIKADNANFGMVDSIFKGDFVKASDYLKEYNDANASIAKINPEAMVGKDIPNDQIEILRKISSATDETTRQQLISQAKLDPVFAEIMSGSAPDYSKIKPIEPTPPIPVDTTPVTPSVPETQTPVTPVVPETPPTDDRAPGYADLPTLPEDGIGQPAPSVPTTPPDSTSSSSSGSGTIGSIGSSIANQVGNIVTNLPNTITNAVTGSLVGQVTNEILGGNEPPKRPTINKPRPPAKVDVGTLRPYTGSLFGETTTTPTTPTTPVGGLPTTPPAKVDPSSLTPYTGPLSFLGQTTTPPTNTTTQTPSGGLQSTQTQTPPTKVDVSRLTPVTDTNLLKSLGIA
jgi:hypothetical protein